MNTAIMSYSDIARKFKLTPTTVSYTKLYRNMRYRILYTPSFNYEYKKHVLLAIKSHDST